MAYDVYMVNNTEFYLLNTTVALTVWEWEGKGHWRRLEPRFGGTKSAH